MTDQPSLSSLTTIAVGGQASRYIRCTTPRHLLDATTDVWATGDDWLVLGGGSNLVVADDGFDGAVIHAATRGIERLRTDDSDRVRLRVQAGEPWDAVVEHAVERGLAGIEALSGIPGSTGAAPMQNIGAYGQELSDTLVAIEFLDYLTGSLERVRADELGLDYRTSTLKQGRQGLVVSVELELERTANGSSAPIRYGQLAGSLGVELEAVAPLEAVRAAVIELRALKGMVLNPADPDSVSCGSFFTNPIVSEKFARSLPLDAPRWSIEPDVADIAVPLGEDPAEPPVIGETRVKLSAGWLIEHSGIERGFSLPGSRAAISGKHTLAIVNTGGATADEIVELARYVQVRVASRFGVELQPEPNLVGVQL